MTDNENPHYGVCLADELSGKDDQIESLHSDIETMAGHLIERDLELSAMERRLVDRTLELAAMRDKCEGLEKDRGVMRELFVHVTQQMWDATCDLSWEDWQEKAEQLGLLVVVPASERFKDEWDADTMLVWSWGDAASSGPADSPIPHGTCDDGVEIGPRREVGE